MREAWMLYYGNGVRKVQILSGPDTHGICQIKVFNHRKQVWKPRTYTVYERWLRANI